MMMSLRAVRVARILLGIFAVLLAYAVLLPSDGHDGLDVLRHVAEFVAGFGLPYAQVFAATEFVANVAMFVPFGLLVPLAVGSLRARVCVLTLAAGFVLSLMIEVAQLAIPGRVSDPRDLVANTLGASLGVILLTAVMSRLDHAREIPAAKTVG